MVRTGRQRDANLVVIAGPPHIRTLERRFLMAEVKLASDEVAVLRAVMSKLCIRGRTGELGIVHGADRFVSTQLTLKKLDRAVLNAVANKVGLKGLAEVA